MRTHRSRSTLSAGGRAVLSLPIVGLAAALATGAASPPPPAVPGSQVPPPVVRDTGANLQVAFNDEVNVRQRYEAAAKQAEREGQPGVARLFRACARSEDVHADRHAQAIAWTNGAEARAVLERPVAGSTADHLRAAIEREQYEVEQFYPPLLQRAREDRQPMAVRSLTFALAAEREHVQLLRTAMETPESAAGVSAYFICPYCGKTVERVDFEKCPNCFTPARRFVRVS